MSRFQGIEYFWDTVKNQSQNRHEAALGIIHWMLIGNGYRCIGRDNEFPAAVDAGRVGTEKLPQNWNDRSTGFYSLLYVHPSQPSNMFLIKLIPAASINDGVIVGQVLIFNSAENTVSFELDSQKFIPDNWNTTDSPTTFPKFKEFTDFVDKDIISKMQGRRDNPGSSSTTGREGNRTAAPFFGQTQPPPSRPIPFVPDVGPPLREFVPPGGMGRTNPFALGSRDLDPFGGMGGNIMGPGNFNPMGIPNSGMSPGWPFRYDPIVPPEFGPTGGLGGPRLPFRGDPTGTGGVGPTFPGRGNPLGGGGGGAFPGAAGIGGLRRPPAPLQPGEPDPDHELPPRNPNPGDDVNNMFM